MSYRKIMIPVFGSVNDQPTLKAAFGLARQFGAHVEALFVRVDPLRAGSYGYIGGDVSGFAAQYVIEAAIRAADEAQKIATTSFDRVVEKFAIQVKDDPGPSTEATARFKIVRGDLLDEIERASRLCDLIVFGSAGETGDSETTRGGFEAALLSGSRAVLFVPAAPPENLGQRIAIAYDGSAAAAHAVTAAMPFLKRAKSVHSFEIAARKGKSEVLKELHDYMVLSGIDVVEHVVDPGSKAAGEVLSQQVQAQHCDLLVLGGYGHSRIREFVFGGVTRHILRHGSSFAVLMAH